MIERIELRDFKAHAHTVVDLGRLTVLVGPNSGGKTSVLEGLQLMEMGLRSNLVFDPPPDVHLVVRDGKGHSTIKMEMGKGRAWVGVISLGKDIPAFTPDFVVYPRGSGGGSRRHIASDELGRCVLTKLDVAAMRQPSGFGGDQGRDRLTASASNLAAQLAVLKLTNDDAFEALSEDIKQVVPSIRKIYARPFGANIELAVDFLAAKRVRARAISEGTLITLALLTYLYEPDPPTLLLIDDIDRGLHPGAQRELIAILRRLLDRRPELQIVATTHSPYIVEAVDPADVRVCALRKDGTVAVKPLLAHPEAHRALEILNAAEFWDAEGESWVTETEDTPPEDTEA